MRQRPRWRLKDAPTTAIFCYKGTDQYFRLRSKIYCGQRSKKRQRSQSSGLNKQLQLFLLFMHQNGRSFLYTHWSLLCRSQNVYAMYADINWYQIELFISRNICSFFSLWLYKFLSVLTKKKVRNTRKIDTVLNTEKTVQNTFRKIRIEPGILRTTVRCANR